VSKHGAYFAGPYKKFRNEMIDLVPEVLGSGFFPYEGALHCDIEMYVRQPKATKLELPRADVDNFIKAIFDSLNGQLWVDDRQIKSVYAAKQWAPKGEEGYFTIGVNEL
jgi:Holliday junction resolvase RusA-like endonuclease